MEKTQRIFFLKTQIKNLDNTQNPKGSDFCKSGWERERERVSENLKWRSSVRAYFPRLRPSPPPEAFAVGFSPNRCFTAWVASLWVSGFAWVCWFRCFSLVVEFDCWFRCFSLLCGLLCLISLFKKISVILKPFVMLEVICRWALVTETN